jgi:putative sigma-54 modulation protein
MAFKFTAENERYHSVWPALCCTLHIEKEKIMETQIQSPHLTIKPDLEQFIYEKMDSLEKLFDRLEDPMVILKVDKTARKENKHAEVSLRMPGMRIFAEDKAETFEQAIVTAIEQVKKQIKKHKDKLKNVQPNGDELMETDII